MRVDNNGISPWHREYVRNNQPVRQDARTEGVRFERTVKDAQKPAGKAPVSPSTDEPKQPQRAENAPELLALLSSEERRTLAQLFPEEGPDWGVAAYRRSAAVGAADDQTSTGHVDLIG
ncbi:MAG: hypothetical protein GXO73_02915 [Calditrichaeota bacterium]|nr:hypothetical protein [Calditrichota bacterium]